MGISRNGARRAVLAAFCLLHAGCGALKASPAPDGQLHGRVNCKDATQPIVVVAVDRDSRRIAHRAFLAQERRFALRLGAGHYKVYAFADADGNGRLDIGESRSVTYVLASRLEAGERIELPALAIL